MLHDKATISQSLTRGFDLCGRREEGRLAAVTAPAPHSGGGTSGFALPSAASGPFGGPYSCSQS